MREGGRLLLLDRAAATALLYSAAAYDEPIQLDSGLQSPRMGSFLFKG